MRMQSVSYLHPACDLLAVNRMASYDDMHEVCLLGTPDRSKRFMKDAGLLLLKHSHLSSPFHVTAQRNADVWIMGSLYSCCDNELNSTVLYNMSTELRESCSAVACTQG